MELSLQVGDTVHILEMYEGKQALDGQEGMGRAPKCSGRHWVLYLKVWINKMERDRANKSQVMKPSYADYCCISSRESTLKI